MALYQSVSESMANRAAFDHSLHVIDNEIVVGLEEFGIPRGNINGIQIIDGITQWALVLVEC